MGFFDDWYNATKNIVLEPDEFFKGVKTDTNKQKAVMFALFNVILGGIANMLDVIISKSEFPEFAELGTDFVASITIVSIILTIPMLAMIAAIINLSLKLLGSQGNFRGNFMLLCYLTIFGLITNILGLAITASGLVGIVIVPVILAFFLYLFYALIRGIIIVNDAKPLQVMGALTITIMAAVIVLFILMMILMAIFYSTYGPDLMMPEMSYSDDIPMQAMSIAGLI